MKILDAIKNFLFQIWSILKYVIIIVGIGVIVGLITKDALIGFLTIGGIILLWGLYGFCVHIWQRITKTGVYEESDKEE